MEFFIIENGQQVGPLTIAQLAEKKIKSSTLVWKEGMANWKPAWEVSELRYILNENNSQGGNGSNTNVPPVPPVPPAMPASATPENPEENKEDIRRKEEPKEKKCHKMWWKILLGIIVLLLLLFAFTNPNKEDHLEAVRTEVHGAIDKMTETSDNNFFTQGIRMVAKMMADNLLGNALNDVFEYHNYILFSKGTVELDGTSHTISYGFLGKVITMNADDMVKALENSDNTEIKTEETTTEDNSVDNSETVDDNSVGSETQSDDPNESNVQKRLEDKADQAIDRVADKVSKKVEDKINKKLDEVTDSSTIDKIIDKILNLL